MAVSFDAAGGSGGPAAGATKSWTHVINASSKIILIYATTDGSNTVSSVTVGGTNATFRASKVAFEALELWSLANPPTGSVTVTVTWGTGTSTNFAGESLSFLGGDGTIGTPVTGTGSASPSSLTVASAVGNMVVDGITEDDGGQACASVVLTPDATQTSRFSNCTDYQWKYAGSTKPGAASVALSWTLSGPGTISWASIAVDVHASSGSTVTGSFTGNAILKKTVNGQVLANAILQKLGLAGSFTANAQLLRRVISSFTGDAILKKNLQSQVLLDAVLKKTIQASNSADAILKKVQTGSNAADAILLKTLSATYGSDAILKKNLAASFSGNSVLLKTLTQALLGDAILKKAQSATFKADAYLQALAGHTGSFTGDAILKKLGITNQFLADAILKRVSTTSFTADARLLKTFLASISGDAILKKNLKGSAFADAYLQVAVTGQTGSFTGNAILKKTGISAALLADAILRKTGLTATVALDAILLRAGATGSFLANAVLQRAGITQQLLANAILRQVGRSSGFSADALLRKLGIQGQFTADAVLSIFSTRIAAILADAILVKTNQKYVFSPRGHLWRNRPAGDHGSSRLRDNFVLDEDRFFDGKH